MDSLLATEPKQNAVVSASAGTGKTWLLVSRIIRLLLAGQKPSTILAVTFTRKAAGEMQARVIDRIFEFSHLADDQLDAALTQIGLNQPDQPLRTKARELYESLIYGVEPIRITTFHSFCQDLLRKFPLEVNVSPGFHIATATHLMEQQALDALYDRATQQPNSLLAQHLDRLAQQLASPERLRTVLQMFLRHTSDWWAYSEDQTDSHEFAKQNIIDFFNINIQQDPISCFTSTVVTDLRLYLKLLGQHTTKTFQQLGYKLGPVVASDSIDPGQFSTIKEIFLTQTNQPRKYKANNSMAKSMGEQGQQEFLSLHNKICAQLLDTLDALACRQVLSLSQAWFYVGDQYLSNYQKIKQEQHCLDFTDLEWQAYRLLTQAETAAWVQYKLDQRTKHLLVDEFQDTNPTQWQLIQPLLEEIASQHDDSRSVFLVGDPKQSIYLFRRAEARLLSNATETLTQTHQAQTFSMNASRRSSPAIIAFINTLFSTSSLANDLCEFTEHDTFHPQLYGRVELLDLIETNVTTEEPSPTAQLRNPLITPRSTSALDKHYLEGQQIALKIQQIIQQGWPVVKNDTTTTISYDDIIILLKNRSHAYAYERALREARIPYVGSSRGTLLDALEIQDMMALLNSLIAPYDNLKLAQVLKSPLFCLSDQDLTQLAEHHPQSWFETLLTLAASAAPGTPIARAAQWLTHWRSLVDKIPIHDLLDKIYCQGNVLQRFSAAFPENLRPRVIANLQRFIQLALEIDSGRYPSLIRFQSFLEQTHQSDLDALDEAPTVTTQARVRFLTIHGAKGLEAPAIFVADLASQHQNTSGLLPVVDWPPNQRQPQLMLLSTSAAKPRKLQQLLEPQQLAQLREQANLLYVALTRARQYLFLTGTAASRADTSWYSHLHATMENFDTNREGKWVGFTKGKPCEVLPALPDAPTLAEIPPHLVAQYPPPASQPSSDLIAVQMHEQDNGLETTIGKLVHRFLDLLTTRAQPQQSVRCQVANEFKLDTNHALIDACLAEAQAVINAPQFSQYFNASAYAFCRNEIPLQYQLQNTIVNGIVDRIVAYEDEILIIDYKTHRNAKPDNLAQLAQDYREQLYNYQRGVKAIWPNKKISSVLLFTYCKATYTFNFD